MITASSNMPVPKFRIHRADGTLPETLKNAFVFKHLLHIDDLKQGFVTIQDGTKWKLVVDEELSIALHVDKTCTAIISFQAHDYGNFAVAKVWKPVPTKKPTKLGNHYKQKMKEGKE